MSPEPTSPDRDADTFLARLAIEAPSPILVAEADTGTVVAVNEAATDLFGRDRSSLIEVTRLKPRPEGRGYSRQFLHNPPPMALPD
ncbi:hypothetical protein, partial [Halorubrum tibetense]